MDLRVVVHIAEVGKGESVGGDVGGVRPGSEITHSKGLVEVLCCWVVAIGRGSGRQQEFQAKEITPCLAHGGTLKGGVRLPCQPSAHAVSVLVDNDAGIERTICKEVRGRQRIGRPGAANEHGDH